MQLSAFLPTMTARDILRTAVGQVNRAYRRTQETLAQMTTAGDRPENDDSQQDGAADIGGDGASVRVTSAKKRADAPRGQSSDAQTSWRVIVDAIPFPAMALDHRGHIAHFNQLIVDVFGKAKIGQPLSYVSRNPDFNSAIGQALASTDPVVVELFERIPVERRISATIKRLDVTEQPGGDMPKLLVTLRDLSEQDRLTQMRADFIANASHELRTPLASLRGFVETLQGPARDDPDARDRFLSIMSSQAARMTRLIDDLLSLSRVEMRVHLPARGTVDLNDVATFVAQSLEPIATAAECTVTVKTSDRPARIRGDREEIVQVMQNLVHNAIKYGREGGNVEIAVAHVMDGVPAQERILVAVADDGPGISSEHLPRLTERFYRANPGAANDRGGTGLGLSIVKYIVIRHRGDLRITSELGKGSTFSILFDDLTAARQSAGK